MNAFQVVIRPTYTPENPDAIFLYEWVDDNIYTDESEAFRALRGEAYHLEHDDGYFVYPSEDGYIVIGEDGGKSLLYLETRNIRRRG